jgi:uncharacterized iron-regulated membrane protein
MSTSTDVAPQDLRRTRTRRLPMRQVFVLIHRYVGLVMAGFLLIAGLTGALLPFYHELDAALNPQLLQVTPPSADARPIDPLVLREQVQARYPEAWVHWVDLAPEPGQALSFWIEGPTAQPPANIPRSPTIRSPSIPTPATSWARASGVISPRA